MSLQIKWSYLFILFFSFFLLSGCGTNNSTAPGNAPVASADNINTIAQLSSNMLNARATVSQDGQTVAIQIQALNKSGVAVNGGEIFVQYPANMTSALSGTMSPSRVQVSSDGVATFNYTAPLDLQAVIDSGTTGAVFKFYDTNNTAIYTNVEVVFDTTAVEVGYGPITNIIVSQPKISLDTPSEQVDVIIYAKNADGVGVTEGTLVVYGPDTTLDAGTVPNEVAIVNGVGTLHYVAPVNLDNVSSAKIFTLKDKTNSAITATMTVQKGSAQSSPIKLLKLSTSSSIQLTANSESVSVSVLALDASGNSVNEGSIIVGYPSNSDGNGNFSSNEVAVSNGVATFNYIGPATLADDNVAWSRTFTFKVKENTYVSKSVTFQYSQGIVNGIIPALIKAVPASLSLSQNNEVRNVTIEVINSDTSTPYDGGTVQVKYDQQAWLDGDDIGTFTPSVANVVNGRAEFVYSGPKALTAGSTSFQFYHSSMDASDAIIFPITFAPASGVTVNETYKLKFVSSDGNNTMNIESKKFFSLSLVDSSGNMVDDGDITTMTVSSLNNIVGQFLDGTDPDVGTLDFTKNNNQVGIQSYTQSGLLPIQVDATFTNADGGSENISAVFNVIVFSGPPTTISISYVGTGQEEGYAQFVEEFSVKLADKYNNPVNTNPMIHVGAIAGYVPSNTGAASHNNLYVGAAVGTIESDGTASKFTVGGYDLSNINPYNDTLVTFGAGYTYHASGKWDIAGAAVGNVIPLKDAYGTDPQSSLGFAIGNNHRQDRCLFGEEWTVTADSDDGTYRVDNNGYVKVKMSYDYYMVGKDAMIYVNLVGTVLGDDNIEVRVGEAKKHTLRGHALTAIPEKGYQLPKLSSGVVVFAMKMTDTAEWYRNGNFGYAVEGTNVTWSENSRTVADSCLDVGGFNNEGVVELALNWSTGDDDGTISVKDVVVATEFR